VPRSARAWLRDQLDVGVGEQDRGNGVSAGESCRAIGLDPNGGERRGQDLGRHARAVDDGGEGVAPQRFPRASSRSAQLARHDAQIEYGEARAVLRPPPPPAGRG